MIFGAHPELGVVRPVHHARIGRGKVTVTDPEFSGLSQANLVHLAFLSTLRQAVGAPLEEWEIPKKVSEVTPDALWHRREGTFAVEVDLGYMPSLVLRKVEAYGAYAGQVWGVISRERARRIYLEARRRRPNQPVEVVLLMESGKRKVFPVAALALLLFVFSGLGLARAPSSYTVVYQRGAPPLKASSPFPSSLPQSLSAGAKKETPPSVDGMESIFAQIFSGEDAPSLEGLAPSESLPPGLFFKAELISGLMAPIGMSTPVLARAEKGWCSEKSCQELYLLGRASLLPTGRSMISFELALLKEGRKVSALRADAVAFDTKDLLYGVKGQVTDVAPALAADLLRAALGGLTDWVDALLKASTVVTDARGRTTVTTEAPPIWATMLGRVGQVVDVPQNTSALIRAVVVSAGEKVMVLTGVGRMGGER